MALESISGSSRMLRSLKVLVQRYTYVGLFLGFILVLLTYFAVSQQFQLQLPNASTGAVSEPRTVSNLEDNRAAKGEEKAATEIDLPAEIHTDLNHETSESAFKRSSLKDKNAEHGGGDDVKPDIGNRPICHVEDRLSETCDISGDVRTHGASSRILVVPSGSTSHADPREWKIRPYSRKHLEGIKRAMVVELGSRQEAPPCTVNLSTPALLFVTGGFIGNFWHDFTDVLVPLFISSRQFDGELQFLVSNFQSWWIGKYDAIFKKLTRYQIIDFDKDEQIRCYPHVIVGTQMHKELSIDPARAPRGYSMVDFTKFLREAYSLPRDSPIRLTGHSDKKPRLMYIQRFHYRRVLNVPDVAELARKLGFEVTVVDPKYSIAEFTKMVNSYDVLVGIHGAGLTNSVFLPTNAVLIQIVPYGVTQEMSQTTFGIAAVDMKLKYIEYFVSAEESTLMEMFGKDHPVIKDPESIHRSGWDKVAEYYLGKQDVRIDVNRFAPYLLETMDHLRK